MNKQRPRWVFVLVLLVLLYGTVLLGYRGSRSLENLEKASGRVQEFGYQLEGSRNQAVMLQLKLDQSPATLKFNAGNAKGNAAAARILQWEQQLRAAAVVTAYYDLDAAAGEAFLYQLEADGVVLISLRQATLFNRIGTLVFLIMLLVAAYFGRLQLLLQKPKPLKAIRHARRLR